MAENHTDEIVHRDLETDVEEPVGQIAEMIAELEEKEPDTLQPLYEQIDHVIDHVFSEPPAPEAQVEITFTYEGYRITVEQNGRAQFIKT